MGLRSNLKLLVGLFLAIVWLFDGLILNAMQFVIYVVIRPMNPTLYRRLNYYLTYASWSKIVALCEWWSNSKMTIYFANEDTKEHFGKEHGLAVMNHNYEVDWLYGWMVCDKFRMLGSAKTFAKSSLQWIPVIGWGWKFCEMIFLERVWNKDSLILAQSLDRLMEYPHTFLLLLFSEGTRFTAEKYEASVKFAKERGLPLLKHHLQPRTRGFVFTVNHVKDRLPAVYNVQLCFREPLPTPSFTSILKGNSIHGHVYLERFPLKDIPTSSEEEISKFLYDLYQNKDNLMDYFAEHGKFPGIETVLPRRKSPLIQSIASFTIILSIFFYLVYTLIVTKNHLILSTIVIGLLAALISVLFLIRSTKAKKGSSYGTSKSSSNTGKSVETSASETLPNTVKNGKANLSENSENATNSQETKKDI